jgi:hypothetical protein
MKFIENNKNSNLQTIQKIAAMLEKPHLSVSQDHIFVSNNFKN